MAEEAGSHQTGDLVAAGKAELTRGAFGVHFSTNGGPDSSIVDELQSMVLDARVEGAQLVARDAADTLAEQADVVKLLLTAGHSDEGNAICVARLYDGRFSFNEAFGWSAYDGRAWQIDHAEKVLERAIVHTLVKRIEAASQPEEFEKHDKLRKFCLPNRGRIEGAKYALSSRVVIDPGTFDAEPDLLNCRNGIVDLRTGELTPHASSQRFMHCTNVAYRPGADPRAWLTWLHEAVGEEQAKWLQLAVGYTLTGHTREEVLFYLFGPSRAGKGLFTETLKAVLGSPLAKEVNFGTFTAQRTGDSQNFDLAPLKPCRMVAASESNSYERFNEAKVKALTGGNEVYAAYKRHDLFNYRPQFKIWLSSNQPVNADPDDDAVWGRLRLVEFPHSHLGSEDKLLKEHMRAPVVLEGVLAWAVAGAIQWYRLGSQGLSEPATSIELKREQRESLDAVAMWIDECCMLGDGDLAPRDVFTASSALYSSYEGWCRHSGVEPKKAKGFGQALMRKRFMPGRDSSGARGFKGLKLKN